MAEESVQMKRFCKQLEFFDAAVFTVLDMNFLFSANTLTYFPLTQCAKDLLLENCFETEQFSEVIRKKYAEKEITKTFEKLKAFCAGQSS